MSHQQPREINLDNNKYTLLFYPDTGVQKALRYGQEWRELTGDNLIYHLGCLIEDLQAENAELKAKIQQVEQASLTPDAPNNAAADTENSERYRFIVHHLACLSETPDATTNDTVGMLSFKSIKPVDFDFDEKIESVVNKIIDEARTTSTKGNH